MSNNNGWIGVDLDGTLAIYHKWNGPNHIGEPIAPMLERVKQWIAKGKRVKIFTARVSHDGSSDSIIEAQAAREAIQLWCTLHLGVPLPVTNEKDYNMIELWDDRAVQVITNTGQVLQEMCTQHG